jgi:DNA gyrase subunit A
VSTDSATIAGVDAGRAKVSYLSEFPAKGRATGGVRAHTFLKGEDALALAWAGPGPALAVASDGVVRTLPDAGARRDASGSVLDASIGSIGASLAVAR